MLYNSAKQESGSLLRLFLGEKSQKCQLKFNHFVSIYSIQVNFFFLNKNKVEKVNMSENQEKKKRTNKKFSPQEDALLKKLVSEYGESSWEDIAFHMKGRNTRQCHDRWVYYLSPKVSNAPWTDEDDQKLIKLVKQLNGKWVQIAKRFRGRNDTQIKNRWNTLKKHMDLPDLPKRKSANSDNISEDQHIEPESKDQKVIVDSAIDKFISLFSSVESENQFGMQNDFDFSGF